MKICRITSLLCWTNQITLLSLLLIRGPGNNVLYKPVWEMIHHYFPRHKNNKENNVIVTFHTPLIQIFFGRLTKLKRIVVFFITAECVNSVVKRLVSHKVQSLTDIVQLFVEIYDLQNKFRDGAFVNQGEFALEQYIRNDPKLRKEFVLTRQEFAALSQEQIKAKRKKFCLLNPPKTLKSKNSTIMHSTDGLMSAPIHPRGGSKPSSTRRPAATRTTSIKSKVKKKQSKEDSEEQTVYDCLNDADNSDTDDDEDGDGGNSYPFDDGQNVEQHDNGLLTHSIFGPTFGNLFETEEKAKGSMDSNTNAPKPMITDLNQKSQVSTLDDVQNFLGRGLKSSSELRLKTAQVSLFAQQNPHLQLAPVPEVDEEQPLQEFRVPLDIYINPTNPFPVGISIVQYANYGNICWANCAMVMHCFSFQKANRANGKLYFDNNGFAAFPPLYMDNFNDFIINVATLKGGNYVVPNINGTERIIRTILYQYWMNRGENEATIQAKLCNGQNEAGEKTIIFKKCVY